MQQVHHYFAYGSNMNENRARERKLHFTSVSCAQLDGFVLKFNKRSRKTPISGRANVMQQTGSVVYGVLYHLCTPTNIVTMDPYEHAPVDYRRIIVEISAPEFSGPSWLYVANPSVVDNSLLPSRSYLKHLLAGRSFLPKSYLEELARVACLD